MKNNTTLFIIGGFVLAILLGIGVTYAFFSAKITGLESASTISLEAGELTITMDGTNTINTTEKLLPDSEVPFSTKVVTLTGKNTTLDLNMPYTLSIVVDENTFTAGSIKYSMTGVNNSNSGEIISNIDLMDVDTTTSIGSGYFGKGNPLTHTYTLRFYFPDTDEDQSINMGKTFKSHIVVTGLEAEKPKLTASNFTKLIGASGENGSLYQDDYGNLRYDGLDPNNYAYFNCDDNENPTEETCEKWRVMGVFELPKVVDDGNDNLVASTTETEKRIKLIREESISIGDVKYHTSSNEWATSLIAAGLANSANGIAYGDNGSGTNIDFYLKDAANSLISPAVWYVGASRSSVTAAEVYTTEHSASTSPWIGSMGLMSESDYGFASSACKGGSKTLYNYSDSTCTESNWLKKGIHEWTMIPYSGDADRVLYVGSDGHSYHISVSNAIEVWLRPTIYLNYDVQVSGTGTTGDRYKFK